MFTARKVVRLALVIGLIGQLLKIAMESLLVADIVALLMAVAIVATSLIGLVGEFAKFIFYEKLAQSVSGAVYRGRHVTLNVDVAVKVIRAGEEGAAAEAERLTKSFLRRMRTASIARHENLLRTYGADVEHGLCYVVMPFVEGETAAERLARRGRLTENEALELCRAAADALAAAHKRDMAHRDVRPDRLFIDKDGKVLVAGLGLAEGAAEEELEISVDAPRRPARRGARSWESRRREVRPDAAAAGAADDIPEGEPAVGKDLEYFVRRYIRSMAHQVVLTYLARRGNGPAEPGELAKSLDMKPAEVKAILGEWQERGFIARTGPHPYFYDPGQKERDIIFAFLREWTDPAQRKLLMAMVLEMEST